MIARFKRWIGSGERRRRKERYLRIVKRANQEQSVHDDMSEIWPVTHFAPTAGQFNTERYRK